MPASSPPSGIRAPSAASVSACGGFRRARWRGAFPPRRAGRAPSSSNAVGSRRPPTRCAKVLAMSSRCARPSSQAALSSEKPFGAGGRHSGSPSSAMPADDACGCRRGTPVARRRATIHSPGRLSLSRGDAQASGAVDQRLRDFLQVAVGVEEALGQPLDQRRRRIVGNEMARELGRDMLRGRRMAGEIGEHRAALLDTRIWIGLADAPVCGPGSCMRALNTNSPPCSGLSTGGRIVQPVSTLAKLVTSSWRVDRCARRAYAARGSRAPGSR